jgi:hypothetical protein
VPIVNVNQPTMRAAMKLFGARVALTSAIAARGSVAAQAVKDLEKA